MTAATFLVAPTEEVSASNLTAITPPLASKSEFKNFKVALHSAQLRMSVNQGPDQSEREAHGGYSEFILTLHGTRIFLLKMC